MQRELEIRQLYIFAMRNYCKILQKLRKNNFLANSILLIDKFKLRDLTDFVYKLDFQFIQIIALRNRFKIAFITVEEVNRQLQLVTDNSDKLRKYRYKIFCTQHYKQNCCLYFIFYLHEAKNKQSNNIINFFRIKSVYLKFFDTLSLQIYQSLDTDYLIFSLLFQVCSDKLLHLISVIDQTKYNSSKSVQQSILKLLLENNILEKISEELDQTRYQEQK